jgi:hypothetical protein
VDAAPGGAAEEDADDGLLFFRAESAASWQCSVRPSKTRYGSSSNFLAPSAARYRNIAYPRELPVWASNPNGPPSSSPNRAKNAPSLSALASGATLVTYTRLPAAAAPHGSWPAEANYADTGRPATTMQGARTARRAAERQRNVRKP